MAEISFKSKKTALSKQSGKQEIMRVVDYTGLHEAAEHLRDLYNRKSQARFDLAFGAEREFSRCRKSSHLYSFYEFIKELLDKERNLPWKYNSFKQAHIIVEAFPDLKGKSRRKLFYSHYRAIANAYLKSHEKQIIRRIFERRAEKGEKITIADIKRELKNRFNIGTYLEKHEVITYNTKRQFLAQVGKMVSDYKEIRGGSRVEVKLKLIRQTKEQKGKAKKETSPSKEASTFSIRTESQLK